MKKILLLTMLLSICNFLKAQTCTISPTFSSQADIDNFSINNPRCTSIDGDVLISGSDINNLAGLAAITSIIGSLRVENNPFLSSLSGLSDITQISGQINIENNSSLLSLTGLDNLSSIGGSLRIVFNSLLQNISSLNKLTTIRGFLSVGVNPSLTSLWGLEHITSISGEISIAQNDLLTDLNGLTGLTTTNGYLYISDNPALTSLMGLMKLTSTNTSHNTASYINISNNDALASLSGLDNVADFDYIRIGNSSSLSYCGVKSICLFIANHGLTDIGTNMAGCNSETEIAATAYCVSLPVTLVNFQGKNTPEGNVLTWQTTSETTNYGFEIERSLNAKTFVKAGFVEGNGDTNETKSYSFTDIITKPMVYYRLKQIDFDQKFSYSRIIIVEGKDKEAATKIYPNPADKQLFIETNNKNQPYQLVNEQGLILQKASSVPSKPLDTGKLPNGMYILNIGKESHKVLIAR